MTSFSCLMVAVCFASIYFGNEKIKNYVTFIFCVEFCEDSLSVQQLKNKLKYVKILISKPVSLVLSSCVNFKMLKFTILFL